MKITQEKLNQILEAHGKWYRSDGAEGERADLRRADLQGAYLRRADLQGADLRRADLQGAYLQGADLQGAYLRRADLQGADLQGADLQGADLQGAYLQGADLRRADLQGADLQGADLQGADLQGAYLQGAYLDKTYYQITRIGSRNATTTYCVEDDNVVCGCWNNYKGGTLEEFRKRVESVYGENSGKPNKKYYSQYIAAIEFFEKMAKLAKKEEEK